MRFKNIDPNKDGKNIHSAADLKHEIQIITLPDVYFEKFKEFLDTHAVGNLIDPDTGEFFYKNKAWFSNGKHHINREFFRKLGRLTDKDIYEMSCLLVDVSDAPGQPRYPRLSNGKAKHYHYDQRSCAEWCARRKNKRIAFQEMKAVKTSLPFFVEDSNNVNEEKWKLWKIARGFSSASWNMLLGHIDKGFYSARLQNQGKLKTAKDLEDKFPGVENFFKKFILLKNHPIGDPECCYLRSVKLATETTLSPQWAVPLGDGVCGLGVFDLRDSIYSFCKGDDLKLSALNFVMKAAQGLKDPSYTAPPIWVWIVNGPMKSLGSLRNQLRNFFPGHHMELSQYKKATNEKLYNETAPEKAANDVCLIYLFKKGDPYADRFKNTIKSEYKPAAVHYYTEAGLYAETKWMTKQSELRMEFYIDLVHKYCQLGDSTLGIFSGSKFMVASVVSALLLLSPVRG